jgi:hypothetical protein
MYRTAIICTYFGSWPRWIPAFFHSCNSNSDFDWLIVTDCAVPALHGQNITFKSMSLKTFNEFVGEKLGFVVSKGAYAQLDFRPAYGVIFAAELAGYDFWGHCDLDVIFGDLGRHLCAAKLASFDIISSRKNQLSGHLTVWRNNRDINRLFLSVPAYRELLSDPSHINFDEKIMSAYLRDLEIRSGSENCPRVCWANRVVVGWPELERNCRKTWLWREGKIYDSKGREQVYLHFRTWQRTMKCTDLNIAEKPLEFRISRRGIWISNRSWQDHLLTILPLDLYWRLPQVFFRKMRKRLARVIN